MSSLPKKRIFGYKDTYFLAKFTLLFNMKVTVQRLLSVMVWNDMKWTDFL